MRLLADLAKASGLDSDDYRLYRREGAGDTPFTKWGFIRTIKVGDKLLPDLRGR